MCCGSALTSCWSSASVPVLTKPASPSAFWPLFMDDVADAEWFPNCRKPREVSQSDWLVNIREQTFTASPRQSPQICGKPPIVGFNHSDPPRILYSFSHLALGR